MTEEWGGQGRIAGRCHLNQAGPMPHRVQTTITATITESSLLLNMLDGMIWFVMLISSILAHKSYTNTFSPNYMYHPMVKPILDYLNYL